MFEKYILIAILFIVVVLVIAWIHYGNTALEINSIKISSKSLPVGFDGFRIAQISDLHNAKFGKNNKKLISLLGKAEANIIVITGDVIDSRRTNIKTAIDFANSATKIAPTYYVNGNHESRLDDTEYNRLITGLKQAGVTVLENDTAEIFMGDEKITLVGINDPAFSTKTDDNDIMEQNIRNVVPKDDGYKVLLVHRPECFDVYVDKVDLVFSGHAHGGQFILPFIGGLIAPRQGLLPEYYKGLYNDGKTNMIVSRGIGNSLFPFRINNRPEIVVAELIASKDK